MPINKNANLRFLVIDECLRNPGKKFFWADLANECANKLDDFNGTEKETVSRRTILNDLKYMESEAGYKAPILRLKDGKKVYFRYEDMDYSINNQPLNTEETQQLVDAVKMLSSLSGRREFEFLDDIIPKLQTKSNPLLDSIPIISYNENKYLKNKDFVQKIFNCIRDKQVLRLVYHPFNAKETVYTFHPHFLKQYNGRWYAFGKCEENMVEKIHPTNFAIDRMVSFDSIDQPHENEEGIDYNYYFEDIIGVSKYSDVPLIKITLRIEPSTYDYIKTKPIHESQRISKEPINGFYTGTIEVIPNFELYKELLVFGDKLEVLSPPEVREKIKIMVTNMYSAYCD
ncbi:MAG: WYL domain-containing protein [Saprospiraceae bacterium]